MMYDFLYTFQMYNFWLNISYKTILDMWHNLCPVKAFEFLYLKTISLLAHKSMNCKEIWVYKPWSVMISRFRLSHGTVRITKGPTCPAFPDLPDLQISKKDKFNFLQNSFGNHRQKLSQ